MISRMAFCSAQAAVTFSVRFLADAGERQQPLRGFLDDGEDVLAESLHQHLGEMGADPLDHAGTEVLLDALQGARRDVFQVGCLELEPVGPVVMPDAHALDELAGGDGGGAPDYRNQFPMPLDLDPEHAEAGLLAVEGNPLDGTGKTLYGDVGAVGFAVHDSLPILPTGAM